MVSVRKLEQTPPGKSPSHTRLEMNQNSRPHLLLRQSPKTTFKKEKSPLTLPKSKKQKAFHFFTESSCTVLQQSSEERPE
ncbi:hypothetical protein CEXT_242801 [Caerostris extrusa]|uniref:Uncharacterized protein n=1 Tax=Caerostris extrusa TaxID=172846 RepID=A0AAV4NWI1_CAEEX|nr:hypothetical protein CEXT_242801 [Caerostris extrusa]